MTEWRPRNRRLFVFSVPEKAKIAGSLLYTPKQSKGFHTSTQEIWILSWAQDCRFQWKRGMKAYITDGFELEPVDLDLWEQYKDLPEFYDLKKYVDEVEGKVKTEIVAEGSILAIDGGPSGSDIPILRANRFAESPDHDPGPSVA